MAPVHVTVHLPATLWRAVQALALHEGDATTVILRAGEEYVTATATHRSHQSGKPQKLVTGPTLA